MKRMTIIAAIAAALVFGSQTFARPASAQYISTAGTAIVVAPGGSYGASVWATLSGGLVYLTCPDAYCNAGDAIAVISTEPGGAPGTTYAIVQAAPVAATYAAPLSYSTYAAPVYSTAYAPYSALGGACVLGSIETLYGCSSALSAPAVAYPYSTGYYGGCVTFCGYGTGFGHDGDHHHGMSGEENGPDVEAVCVLPQTFHEHPEGCR
jgi:hypothetical protein